MAAAFSKPTKALMYVHKPAGLVHTAVPLVPYCEALPGMGAAKRKGYSLSAAA